MFETRSMTSVNLEKTLEYLKMQESLRSENLTGYYLGKSIFLHVFLNFGGCYTRTKYKINH